MERQLCYLSRSLYHPKLLPYYYYINILFVCKPCKKETQAFPSIQRPLLLHIMRILILLECNSIQTPEVTTISPLGVNSPFNRYSMHESQEPIVVMYPEDIRYVHLIHQCCDSMTSLSITGLVCDATNMAMPYHKRQKNCICWIDHPKKVDCCIFSFLTADFIVMYLSDLPFPKIVISYSNDKILNRMAS